MTDETLEVKTEIQTGPMDWTDRARKVVEIAIAAEMHAFALLGAGLWLVISGHKDEGSLVLGGALGIFKGNK